MQQFMFITLSCCVALLLQYLLCVSVNGPNVPVNAVVRPIPTQPGRCTIHRFFALGMARL